MGEDVQCGFEADAHPVGELLSKHPGQSGIHFGGWGNSAVEFQDPAAEIGGEHEVDDGDFGLVSVGHVGYCLLSTYSKISVFVRFEVIYTSSARSKSEATYQWHGSSTSS